jgi:hypothetical protein
MSRNKYLFFRFEYHMFCVFISICDLFIDSPSYNSTYRMVVAWYFDLNPVKLLRIFVSAVVFKIYAIAPPQISNKFVTVLPVFFISYVYEEQLFLFLVFCFSGFYQLIFIKILQLVRYFENRNQLNSTI